MPLLIYLLLQYSLGHKTCFYQQGIYKCGPGECLRNIFIQGLFFACSLENYKHTMWNIYIYICSIKKFETKDMWVP